MKYRIGYLFKIKPNKTGATLNSSNSIKYLFLLTATLLLSLAVFSQNIPARPNPPRLVNDFAGVLLPEQRDDLERKLVALDDSTSNQIAVVLIKTLNDYPIEDYSIKLFRSWGIGNKQTNNGVLLIAAIEDHQVRIEVGYGLEGAIPDITANTIIENDIVPNFKAGNYFRGIDVATDDLSKAAAGEYHEARKKDNNNDNGGGGGGTGLGIIIIVIIILILMRSGGRGGRGGGMISRRGYGGMAPWIIASMLNSGNRGWRDSGGGFGGGGFGGGGGGGFGGFGGGSSGGGGASGSW